MSWAMNRVLFSLRYDLPDSFNIGNWEKLMKLQHTTGESSELACSFLIQPHKVLHIC